MTLVYNLFWVIWNRMEGRRKINICYGWAKWGRGEVTLLGPAMEVQLEGTMNSINTGSNPKHSKTQN